MLVVGELVNPTPGFLCVPRRESVEFIMPHHYLNPVFIRLPTQLCVENIALRRMFCYHKISSLNIKFEVMILRDFSGVEVYKEKLI